MVTVSTFEELRSQPGKRAGKSILSTVGAFGPSGDIAGYLKVIEKMSFETARACPTVFHWMLDGLAERGDRIHIYSQNIDGLENRCPHLSNSNTATTHGQVNIMACNICLFQAPIDMLLFKDGTLPACPQCPGRTIQPHPARTRKSLPRNDCQPQGVLKPYVQLYDSAEGEWPDLQFDNLLREDTKRHSVQTIIVAGTGLAVSGTRDLLKDIMNTSPAATTIWVNTVDVPKRFETLFDYAIRGSCDDVANFLYFEPLDSGLPQYNSASEPPRQPLSVSHLKRNKPNQPRRKRRSEKLPAADAAAAFHGGSNSESHFISEPSASTLVAETLLHVNEDEQEDVLLPLGVAAALTMIRRQFEVSEQE